MAELTWSLETTIWGDFFFLLEAVQLVSSSELSFYDALSHFAMGIIFAVENSFILDASATEFLVITYIKIE